MTLKSLAAQLPMQYYQEVPNEQELSQSAQDEGAAIHSLRFHLQDLLVDDTLDSMSPLSVLSPLLVRSLSLHP